MSPPLPALSSAASGPAGGMRGRDCRWEERWARALGSCPSIRFFEMPVSSEPPGVACLSPDMEVHGAESPLLLRACQLSLPSEPGSPKAAHAGGRQAKQALCRAREEKQAAVRTARPEVSARQLLACPDETGPRPLLGSRVASPAPASSGKLVIRDHGEPIALRTRHILIDSGGELHAGSALCPFQGNFSIVLYGRWVGSAHGSSVTLGPDGREALPRGTDEMAGLSCKTE